MLRGAFRAFAFFAAIIADFCRRRRRAAHRLALKRRRQSPQFVVFGGATSSPSDWLPLSAAARGAFPGASVLVLAPGATCGAPWRPGSGHALPPAMRAQLWSPPVALALNEVLEPSVPAARCASHERGRRAESLQVDRTRADLGRPSRGGGGECVGPLAGDPRRV